MAVSGTPRRQDSHRLVLMSLAWEETWRPRLMIRTGGEEWIGPMGRVPEMGGWFAWHRRVVR